MLLSLNWISGIPPVIERCNSDNPPGIERCKFGNRCGGDEILSEGESNKMLEMAVKEASYHLSAAGVSLADVCAAVEGASSREELQESLGQFNPISISLSMY